MLFARVVRLRAARNATPRRLVRRRTAGILGVCLAAPGLLRIFASRRRGRILPAVATNLPIMEMRLI
jgi:hypothetical protein